MALKGQKEVKNKLAWATYKSPVGSIFIYVEENNSYLYSIQFQQLKNVNAVFHEVAISDYSLLQKTASQLSEYFEGHRKIFNLPLNLMNFGTVFQQEVWQLLTTIPYGQTCSYKEQALKLKNPKAVRAVARSNGLNPYCIIVPCHRVIASNGSLTGYVGGIAIKKYLLDLEQRFVPCSLMQDLQN